MKQTFILGISLLALTMMAACSPAGVGLVSEDPIVQPEIPQFEPVELPNIGWITEDGGQTQLDFNPQVDILFVTDNSDSMRVAQENLVKNLDRFTAGISSNKAIDYHIGVVSTWDSSERFIKNKKDNYGIGELRFIKDAKGNTHTSKRFVTKAESSSVLASTLKIGVAAYEQGGPEVEEFFSPLMASLEKTGRGATNEGFFRENAHLVVVLVTDADDSSAGISPEQMGQALIDFKGGRRSKVSVYGVLVNAKTPDKFKDWGLRVHPNYHPECFDMSQKPAKNNGTCVEGFGPKNIESFIYFANDNSGTLEDSLKKYTMSITSADFGKDLGKIGDEITTKTLTLEKEILLQHRPKVDSKTGALALEVYYGSQKLGKDKGLGWAYNPENNSVLVKYRYVEGARFTVRLIPLNTK